MSNWSTFWSQVKAWWNAQQAPSPAPVPVPQPTPAPGMSGFTAVRDHSDSRPGWMCGGLILASDGSLYTGLINDPRNPETVEVWRDGVRLISASRETIGQPIEFGGAEYFPTESGGSGRWLRCTGATVTEMKPCRHSALAVVWHDRPCIVSSENAPRGEVLLDAETGAVLLTLAVSAGSGIPFAACPMPGAAGELVIALADGDGKEGRSRRPEPGGATGDETAQKTRTNAMRRFAYNSPKHMR